MERDGSARHSVGNCWKSPTWDAALCTSNASVTSTRLPLGTVQANPGINPDYLRPYKGYGTIRVTNNDANAIYHGLQIGYNKRFSKGITYGLAYTLSKSMDDGSAQRDILPNPFDRFHALGTFRL